MRRAMVKDGRGRYGVRAIAAMSAARSPLGKESRVVTCNAWRQPPREAKEASAAAATPVAAQQQHYWHLHFTVSTAFHLDCCFHKK